MNTDDLYNRQAFEKWFSNGHIHLQGIERMPNQPDYYRLVITQTSWLAWKACVLFGDIDNDGKKFSEVLEKLT